MDLRNIFSYVAICTCTRFGSSVNISISIGQKSFVFSKYTSKWKASTTAIFQQVWQYHKSCNYLPSLSIISLTFETFALSVTITCWPVFVSSLTDTVPIRNFFLPIRYLVRSLHSPPKYSKNVHLYWMTEFSANFYISSNFFNILNRFQTIFTSEVNDRPIWNDSEKHNTWS